MLCWSRSLSARNRRDSTRSHSNVSFEWKVKVALWPLPASYASESVDWVKKCTLSRASVHHPVHQRPKKNKKMDEESILSAWVETFIFFYHQTSDISASGSRAFELKLGLESSASFLVLWTQTILYHLFSWSSACRQKSVGLPQSHELIPIINRLLSVPISSLYTVCIYFLLILFLGRTLTNTVAESIFPLPSCSGYIWLASCLIPINLLPWC